MGSITAAIEGGPGGVRPGLAEGVFRGVQVALFPLAAAGYVLWLARMIRYSRRSGGSATVLASQYARWMQHRLGTRRDEPCARLMKVMPNVPALGLALVTAPTLLGHRLTKFVPRVFRYPYAGPSVIADQPAARTTFFDAALERHAVAVEQFVVLGAGLDTRGQRLPANRHIRCFEVDTPKTQAFKLAMLQRAGVSTSTVTYVSADFEQDSWLEQLVAAGFDPKKPTFFLWESVCMYLDREAVESTLGAIASTAPGNVVAFDYLAKELVEARSLLMRYARAVLGVLGEPWTFGIEAASPGDVSRSPEQGPTALVTLLESCGLSLVEHQTVWQDASREAVAAGFVVAVTRGGSASESRRLDP